MYVSDEILLEDFIFAIYNVRSSKTSVIINEQNIVFITRSRKCRILSYIRVYKSERKYFYFIGY